MPDSITRPGPVEIQILFCWAAARLRFLFAGRNCSVWDIMGNCCPTHMLNWYALLARLGSVWNFITPFLLQSALILVISMAEVVHLRFRNIVFWMFITNGDLYQVSVGGDAWREWHMLAPAMPFLLSCRFCRGRRGMGSKPSFVSFVGLGGGFGLRAGIRQSLGS